MNKLNENLFNIYQLTLEWIDGRSDPQTLEFYGEELCSWDHTKEIAFKMYQSLRLCIDGAVPQLQDCFYSEDSSSAPAYKDRYPYIGYIEYRGQKFPVYNDDYGQEDFIVLNNEVIPVYNMVGEVDWYYRVDEILDKI